MHGERARWGDAEHLLALVADLLAAANWQRAGRKSAPRPKPIDRPGVAAKGTKRIGTARPVAEVRRILDNWGR